MAPRRRRPRRVARGGARRRSRRQRSAARLGPGGLATLSPDEQAAQAQDYPAANLQEPQIEQDDAEADAEIDQMADAEGPGELGPTGIVNVTASPFSTQQYLIANHWEDISADGGSYVEVYAGSFTDDQQQGVLVVNVLPYPNDAGEILGTVDEYRTPSSDGGAEIVSVDGQSIYFTTESGALWVFNLATRQFDRPPDCSRVAPDATTLWPPNHKFRLVSLAGASDPDGDPVTLAVTGVTQDEPVNGSGDGNTAPDAQQAAESNQVLLRSERSGGGDGRVYRIAFRADDGRGGACTGTAIVSVPHNPGRAAVDSGQSFDSFG